MNVLHLFESRIMFFSNMFSSIHGRFPTDFKIMFLMLIEDF